LSGLSDYFERDISEVMSTLKVLRDSGLTEQQATFVRHIGAGESPVRAAEMAGYSEGQIAHALLRNPNVLRAVHIETARLLVADGPTNFKVLRKIRDDETAPKGVRADVAIKLGRLAGHVEPTKAAETHEKPLSEMTAEELRQYVERSQREIDRMEGELAARATPVSAPLDAPEQGSTAPKPLNYLD